MVLNYIGSKTSNYNLHEILQAISKYFDFLWLPNKAAQNAYILNGCPMCYMSSPMPEDHFGILR